MQWPGRRQTLTVLERRLAPFFLIRSETGPTTSWAPAVFWLGAAAISIGIAIAIGLRPGGLGDLHIVRAWLAYVRTQDGNPYTYFRGEMDYPPLALLVLWPLSLPSDATIAYWYFPTILVIRAVALWVFLRWTAGLVGVRLGLNERVALVALSFAGGATRGAFWLGQTTSLAVLFGALSLHWSARRPFAAALMLALASFKPHLAAGFGLAIAVTIGIDVPLIAVAIVISLSIIIADVIGVPFVSLAGGWISNLAVIYTGPGHLRGLLSVQMFFEDVLEHYALATALFLLTALGALAAVLVLSRRRRDRPAIAHLATVSMIWSVIFLPSQLYNSIMAAPALWLMMWPESQLFRRAWTRIIAVGSFLLFGVIDVPRVMRWIGRQQPEGHQDLFWWSYYVSPLRMAILFGFLLYVMVRRSRRDDRASTA